MARILVLGAGGMAGHMARIYLRELGHEVIAVARSPSNDWDCLDVENETLLENYIEDKRPSVILNCVGVLIKESEENPIRAIRINSLLPRLLSNLGEKQEFRLIHLSSDCVFSGTNAPYYENSLKDADDIYGRSKALGEVITDRDLTIRTSIVGPELKPSRAGLFNWFMSQHGTIKGFTKAMWGGVTTLEMAKAIDAAIGQGTTGLIHLTNGVPISKYDLLSLFKEIWKRDDINIDRDDTRVSDRSLVCSRTDYKYSVPSYRTMLGEMKEFMGEHQKLYEFY